MAAIPVQQNVAGQAFSRAQEIVGQLASSAKSVTSPFFSSSGTYSSPPVTGVFTPQGGNVLLSSVYYVLIFLFILFVILIIIDQTVKPIFSLTPGSPGIISLPGATDDEIFWTSSYPSSNDYRPRDLDKLVGIDLKTNFTVSVDCYLPALSGIPMYKRVLFFKGARNLVNSTLSGGVWENYPSSTESRSTIEALRGQLATKNVSMVTYVDEMNKLYVDFFSGTGTNRETITLGPIDNVPTSQPFRMTLAVESKLIDFYLNGRLVQSRALRSSLTSPVAGKEAIFPAPTDWRFSKGPVTTASCSGGAASGIGIKLLNLHLWPRAISAAEASAQSPRLPDKSKWDTLNKTDTTAAVPSQTIGQGSLDGEQQCQPQTGGNPLKNLDTKSTILIIAALAAAVYLFKNNQPQA